MTTAAAMSQPTMKTEVGPLRINASTTPDAGSSQPVSLYTPRQFKQRVGSSSSPSAGSPRGGQAAHPRTTIRSSASVPLSRKHAGAAREPSRLNGTGHPFATTHPADPSTTTTTAESATARVNTPSALQQLQLPHRRSLPLAVGAGESHIQRRVIPAEGRHDASSATAGAGAAANEDGKSEVDATTTSTAPAAVATTESAVQVEPSNGVPAHHYDPAAPAGDSAADANRASPPPPPPPSAPNAPATTTGVTMSKLALNGSGTASSTGLAGRPSISTGRYALDGTVPSTGTPRVMKRVAPGYTPPAGSTSLLNSSVRSVGGSAGPGIARSNRAMYRPVPTTPRIVELERMRAAQMNKIDSSARGRRRVLNSRPPASCTGKEGVESGGVSPDVPDGAVEGEAVQGEAATAPAPLAATTMTTTGAAGGARVRPNMDATAVVDARGASQTVTRPGAARLRSSSVVSGGASVRRGTTTRPVASGATPRNGTATTVIGSRRAPPAQQISAKQNGATFRLRMSDLTKPNEPQKVRLAPSNTHRMQAVVKRGRHQKKLINVFLSKYPIVRQIAQQMGFEIQETEDELEQYQFNLCWSDTVLPLTRIVRFGNWQRSNHFPSMYLLTRKAHLGVTLGKLRRQLPTHFSFYPHTWTIRSEREQFTRYYTALKAKKLIKFFIVKPNAGCQGRGIVVTRDPFTAVEDLDNFIVQEYISRPLLMEGRKFDLRVYVLLTSIREPSVFLFNDGLVRVCTEAYEAPSDLNAKNACKHLTNYAVNKHSADYVYNTDVEHGDVGNKRNFRFFNRWLSEQGHDPEVFWDRVSHLVVKTILAAQPQIRQVYDSCFPRNNDGYTCFEMLGFDVLVDSSMRPWLMEVNHTPSLATDTPLDMDIKSRLVSQIWDIVDCQATDYERDRQREREEFTRRNMPPWAANHPLYSQQLNQLTGTRMMDRDTPLTGHPAGSSAFNSARTLRREDPAISGFTGPDLSSTTPHTIHTPRASRVFSPVTEQPPEDINGVPAFVVDRRHREDSKLRDFKRIYPSEKEEYTIVYDTIRRLAEQQMLDAAVTSGATTIGVNGAVLTGPAQQAFHERLRRELRELNSGTYRSSTPRTSSLTRNARVRARTPPTGTTAGSPATAAAAAAAAAAGTPLSSAQTPGAQAGGTSFTSPTSRPEEFKKMESDMQRLLRRRSEHASLTRGDSRLADRAHGAPAATVSPTIGADASASIATATASTSSTTNVAAGAASSSAEVSVPAAEADEAATPAATTASVAAAEAPSPRKSSTPHPPAVVVPVPPTTSTASASASFSFGATTQSNHSSGAVLVEAEGMKAQANGSRPSVSSLLNETSARRPAAEKRSSVTTATTPAPATSTSGPAHGASRHDPHAVPGKRENEEGGSRSSTRRSSVVRDERPAGGVPPLQPLQLPGTVASAEAAAGKGAHAADHHGESSHHATHAGAGHSKKNTPRGPAGAQSGSMRKSPSHSGMSPPQPPQPTAEEMERLATLQEQLDKAADADPEPDDNESFDLDE